MRQTLLTAIAVLAAAAAGAVALPISHAARIEHGARIVDEAWTKAILAGDLDAIVALYAPDAVMYPPGGMVQKGREEIRKGYADMLAGMKVTEFRFTYSHFETAGDLSVGWGTWVMTMAPKGGGEPITLEGRSTAVARRIGGKWMYVSDHASQPAPPPPAPAAPAAAPGKP